MTDEQKRFKIQKIESYEEQISQENKEAILKTFLLGLVAAGTLHVFTTAANANSDIDKILLHSAGLLETYSCAYVLKGLIESIIRKTNLQNKIEDINSELEMPENKESRGMKKW